MRLTTSVQVKGNGLTELVKELQRLDGLAVKVGILGNAGTDAKGTSIVDIGLIHEFGAPNAGIPERSFIRSTFENRARAMGDMAEKMAGRVLSGKGNAEQSLNLIGSYLASEIKKTIVARISPANAQSTIERKGSDVPLVDTGQLLNSISWAVEHTDGRGEE